MMVSSWISSLDSHSSRRMEHDQAVAVGGGGGGAYKHLLMWIKVVEGYEKMTGVNKRNVNMDRRTTQQKAEAMT